MTHTSASVVIHPETPDDHDAVRQVVTAAFESDVQGRLVDRIRASPEYVPDLALVARLGGVIVGFVMISHAVIRNDTGDARISTLSPLAVHPDHQRSGIGQALVAASLAVAEARGEPMVVLEGNPAYYGRLGFEPTNRLGIEMHLPEWASPEAAQVVRLSRLVPDDPAFRGTVVYPEAFDGLE